LIAAIAAGGWIAVLVIIIICLIGLLVGSCFGIFFSGEDSGSGYTIQNVVQESNNDYQQQIDTTKANLSYDVLEMSGSRAVWPEVLSVYAVKTTTDPDNAQEVATIDDSKKAILKDIFWQMNEISSRTETKTETVITETDDGHGNIVETETTVTQTYLYITVSHKTADEMAEQYGFDDDQREQLANCFRRRTAVCGVLSFTVFTPRMGLSSPWHSPKSEMLAASRTGAGMDLTAAWNGVRRSFPGVPMSADISTPE